MVVSYTVPYFKVILMLIENNSDIYILTTFNTHYLNSAMKMEDFQMI
jgi:hypothetical protein